MDINNRMKNLENWKIKKNIEENAKRLAEEERHNKIVADIEALWPRAKELIDLYNAGVDMGLPYPEEKTYSNARAMESNGWSHWLGVGYYDYRNPDTHLVVNRMSNRSQRYANAISIRGGGASYYEIDLIDGHLIATGSYKWSRLEKFVEDFNKFEEYFYNWFDKITTAEG
jgi:hypothetical protein